MKSCLLIFRCSVNLLDTLGQNGYLGTRATRIILVYLRALDSRSFLLSCNHLFAILTDHSPYCNRVMPKCVQLISQHSILAP